MGLVENDRNIFFYNFQDGADGGLKGPNGDVYLYPHTQVDAQVSYRLPHAHGIHLIVSMLNLNNEVFGFYQGSEQFPIQREYYIRTIAGGLRSTSNSELKSSTPHRQPPPSHPLHSPLPSVLVPDPT